MAKSKKSTPTFDEYYSQYLGTRWPALKASLVKDEVQVERWNQFSSQFQACSGGQQFTDLTEKKALERDEEGLLVSYIMDPASIFVANALDVKNGDRVLDMCAAPGGKTLILAERIGSEGELLANEVSENRRDKLKKVIQQYIPLARRQNIWVTGRDGGLFAKTHPEVFDRILVDAPCSGERYLMKSPSDLQDWTPQWPEKLGQRQYALLTGALLASKVGGRIVYSTCAASPLENDEVVRKLLKKKKDQFRILSGELPVLEAERTEFGIQLWPDKTGMGPIYYCIFEKI